MLAREEQLPPQGNWRTWLLLGGRGSGKTRSGAEWVQANIDLYGRWHLVGPTAAAVRDVMVEGESGILAIARNGSRPKYEPSKLRLTWPNGAVASLFSADEPDRLRGPQCEAAWGEEVATWRYPEAWDMLQLGLRLGPDPKQVVTTTPRPVRIVRDLLDDSNTVVTKMTSYANRDNLAPAFFEQIIRRYEGTRLGRQELMGELLEDVPGALWQRQHILMKSPPQEYVDNVLGPAMSRIVVGVDPAATSTAESDETGIVVDGMGKDGFGYTLADRSIRGTPDAWAKRAVAAYREFRADIIVAEANNGGEMVAATIHAADPNVPVKLVHASRGKVTRAQPLSLLYEQGRWFHAEPFPELEDQMCSYVSGSPDSPDRMDAHVWAASELTGGYTGDAGGSWIA